MGVQAQAAMSRREPSCPVHGAGRQAGRQGGAGHSPLRYTTRWVAEAPPGASTTTVSSSCTAGGQSGRQAAQANVGAYSLLLHRWLLRSHHMRGTAWYCHHCTHCTHCNTKDLLPCTPLVHTHRKVAPQDALCQRRLQLLLHHALDGAGAKGGVVPTSRQVLHSCRAGVGGARRGRGGGSGQGRHCIRRSIAAPR